MEPLKRTPRIAGFRPRSNAFERRCVVSAPDADPAHHPRKGRPPGQSDGFPQNGRVAPRTNGLGDHVPLQSLKLVHFHLWERVSVYVGRSMHARGPSAARLHHVHQSILRDIQCLMDQRWERRVYYGLFKFNYSPL